MAWFLWAFGGTLRPLFDQFLFRTGQSSQPVSFSALLAAQRHTVLVMYGVAGLAAIAGLVVAARYARTRGLVVVALALTVPYSLVFRTGAVNHEYWGYWFLLPVTLGLAAGAERVLAYWRSRGRPEAVLLGAMAVLAGLATLVAWTQPPTGESLKITGYRAAVAAGSVELDPGQRTSWFAGAVGEPASWLSRESGRPAVPVLKADHAELAATHPADLVLVGEVRCAADGIDHTYEMRPARTLVDRPPVIATC